MERKHLWFPDQEKRSSVPKTHHRTRSLTTPYTHSVDAKLKGTCKNTCLRTSTNKSHDYCSVIIKDRKRAIAESKRRNPRDFSFAESNQSNREQSSVDSKNTTHRLHCWQKRRSWPATTTRGHLVWASHTRCFRWYSLAVPSSSPHPSTWHLTSAPPPSSPLARFPSRSFPPRRAGASPEEPEPAAEWSPQSQSRGGEEGEAVGFGAVHSMPGADLGWSIWDLGIEERRETR